MPLTTEEEGIGYLAGDRTDPQPNGGHDVASGHSKRRCTFVARSCQHGFQWRRGLRTTFGATINRRKGMAEMMTNELHDRRAAADGC